MVTLPLEPGGWALSRSGIPCGSLFYSSFVSTGALATMMGTRETMSSGPRCHKKIIKDEGLLFRRPYLKDLPMVEEKPALGSAL